LVTQLVDACSALSEAISALAIITVILMLFLEPGESERADVPTRLGCRTIRGGLGLLLAGVNPKNLLLEVGAGSALAVIGPSTSEAVVSLIVFVVVGSLTIAGPVVFYLVGGDRAKTPLESAKGWLVLHNDAVMLVLFLVFGVDLIAKRHPAVDRMTKPLLFRNSQDSVAVASSTCPMQTGQA
jgi:hypothetical protein